MIFNIATTHRPATDLGFLLHKNPARAHAFNLNSGRAHVFYTQATPEDCEATLLVETDPVNLVRGKSRDTAWSLGQYANDRPYASSSFLSTAIADVYGTAMNGRCRDKPELAQLQIPLRVTIPVLTSTTGEDGIRRVFEPLGYTIDIKQLPLDEQFTNWGKSRYFHATFHIQATVALVLQHFYVLIPVLDKNKHYFIADDEVEKLLAKGGEWLANHTEREWITRRYLKNRRLLAQEALKRLEELESPSPADELEGEQAPVEEQLEKPIKLHEQRLNTVTELLRDLRVQSVVDLGCGEAKLLRRLLEETSIPRIIGMDVSCRSLEIAQRRLKLDRLPPAQRDRITLLLGSLLYRDARLENCDAAVLVEVIEHLDLPRLRAMERVVFERSQPKYIIVTTPNSEYNVKFESLPAGQYRHADHRFEWTRDEFSAWANRVAELYGYTAICSPLGPVDSIVGAPSQMAQFTRKEVA